MPTTTSPTILGPADGDSVTLQTIGVRFMIPGADSGDRFSLVEHPIPPRTLAAPLHRHNREDEYSFVLEGRMGALLGDDVVEAGPGDLVYKLTRSLWIKGTLRRDVLASNIPGGSSASTVVMLGG